MIGIGDTGDAEKTINYQPVDLNVSISTYKLDGNRIDDIQPRNKKLKTKVLSYIYLW